MLLLLSVFKFDNAEAKPITALKVCELWTRLFGYKLRNLTLRPTKQWP